ncbi:hypothetical protein GCM10023237_07870 [Streptomyces coeruleoprunus]
MKATASICPSRSPARSGDLTHDRVERLQVRPEGELGHDAAEAGVLVHARRHDMGEQLPVPHDPGTGLVARGLDPEYHRSAHRPISFCADSHQDRDPHQQAVQAH